MENRSRIAQMQMRRIVSKYELGDLLGRGSYSEVFQARHLEQGKMFAIKVISNKILAQNLKVKEYISNELAIHNVLQPCSNIVRFIELLQTKNNCYFVYQYCQGGTLHQMLKKQGVFDQKKALMIFNQLVQGLKVLRKHKIMHRDLKPQNILIKEGSFKLADFGFCKELGGQCMTRTMLGSPLYMAPEVLRGQAYSVNADIWSIGVILYEMLYGRCPFQSNSIASLISTIDDTHMVFDPSINVSTQTKKFISKCLQKDCRLRIAWQQLFEQVSILIEKANTVVFSNSSQLFLKSLSKIVPKPNSTLNDDHRENSNPSLQSQSKSKYEIFKQNYNKNAKNKQQSQLLYNTTQNLKGDRNISQIGRHSDLHLKQKQKIKQQKLSFKQLIYQHQNCWKLLKCILQRLQSRDAKIYPSLCQMMKGLKKILDKIYTRINLDNTQMLPVLSIVKYEQIQIQIMYSEIEKVLPFQHSDVSIVEFTIQGELGDLWKKVKQFY